MAITSTQVTVTTSATLIYSATHRTKLFLAVGDSQMLFGGPGVTTSTGTHQGSVVSAGGLDLSGGDDLYGVLAAGSAVVEVLAITL